MVGIEAQTPVKGQNAILPHSGFRCAGYGCSVLGWTSCMMPSLAAGRCSAADGCLASLAGRFSVVLGVSAGFAGLCSGLAARWGGAAQDACTLCCGRPAAQQGRGTAGACRAGLLGGSASRQPGLIQQLPAGKLPLRTALLLPLVEQPVAVRHLLLVQPAVVVWVGLVALPLD